MKHDPLTSSSTNVVVAVVFVLPRARSHVSSSSPRFTIASNACRRCRCYCGAAVC